MRANVTKERVEATKEKTCRDKLPTTLRFRLFHLRIGDGGDLYGMHGSRVHWRRRRRTVWHISMAKPSHVFMGWGEWRV